MKQKHYFIKPTFVIVFLLLSIFGLISQNNKLNLLLAYETAQFTNNEYQQYLVREGNIAPEFKLGLNYRLTKVFIIGGYLNYCRFANPFLYTTTHINNGIEEKYDWFGFGKSNAFAIGANLNINLLPLIIKEKELRFNFYSKIQMGALYNNSNNNVYIKSGFKPEYGAGLGLSYNITKGLGLFGEYMIGDFYNDDNSKLTMGLKINL